MKSHRVYNREYRGLQNLWEPLYLKPRLWYSQPRFIKPVIIAKFETAVTSAQTAVYETGDNRCMWNRGYDTVNRGL